MQRRKLFTYWEGPKPEFVTMCEEIIAHKVTNTFDYIRLTPENLYQYIELVNHLYQILFYIHRNIHYYIMCQ